MVGWRVDDQASGSNGEDKRGLTSQFGPIPERAEEKGEGGETES